jgi:hypothetical protein
MLLIKNSCTNTSEVLVHFKDTLNAKEELSIFLKHGTRNAPKALLKHSIKKLNKHFNVKPQRRNNKLTGMIEIDSFKDETLAYFDAFEVQKRIEQLRNEQAN